MKSIKLTLVALVTIGSTVLVFSQSDQYKTTKGHNNDNPFAQLYDLLPTPTKYRTATGTPGSEYYQQQVDYNMDIVLDDVNNILKGEETITYYNNSPDTLDYLWLSMDQNLRKKDSPYHLYMQQGAPKQPMSGAEFSRTFMEEYFDGGFNVDYVKDSSGKDLQWKVIRTSMRVIPSVPIKPGAVYIFKIKWNYNIPNYFVVNDRNGFEPHKKGNIYAKAQFYPRLMVYNDVEGWQNMPYWNRSEYALEFGNFKVNITVPADHLVNATGELTNMREMLTDKQYERYQKAKNNFAQPMMIVTDAETTQRIKEGANGKTKTWRYEAQNVRDFAFVSSRAYMWDAMAVKIGDKTVMAESVYPKEGGSLWYDLSTKAVAHTLKTYSKYTFDYPYPKAVSASVQWQGMEYPMISFNGGRANADGSYTQEMANNLVGLIIHEVGHNFFSMIINSDERQWTWMDESLNTFIENIAEQEWSKDFPSRRIRAEQIVDYMQKSQEEMMPIMTQGDLLTDFGNEGYSKPAIGLHILRNTILGPENFDYAFKTYAQRWKFKHPTPADFFRTMDDASGVDLDWFFRGWFFTTEVVDLGIKTVSQLYPSESKTALGEDGIKFTKEKGNKDIYSSSAIKDYLRENPELKVTKPNYFYEVEYERVGGMPMPLLVTFTFEDGSSKEIRYPVEVWRFPHRPLKKMYGFDKPLKSIEVDKNKETADVNLGNNIWKK